MFLSFGSVVLCFQQLFFFFSVFGSVHFCFQHSFSVHLPFNSFCSVHFSSCSILFGAFDFYLFLLVQFDNMRNFHMSLDFDENQIKEAFIKGGRGHPPSHLKFFLLVFSKLKEDIK